MSEPTPTTSRQPSRREDALAVVKRLREKKHVAYFAGGCVRDLLLGLEPKDYDVATDAPPERVREIFAASRAVGAAFGVVLVRQGVSQIEVATFRADMEYEDGRRPVGVRFTTAEEDAQRRDFTINGLFLDPLEDRVIDFVGGQEDIRAKILRAIGKPEERFHEDHLRLLRAVRFAARFGLSIEAKTAEAMAHHAEHLKRISPERIAEELRLMLTPSTRVAAWEMLWRFKLMHVIFRTLPEKPAAPLTHAIFTMISAGEVVSFPLALAAMSLCYRRTEKPVLDLLDLPEVRKSVQACRTTLKISNEEYDRVRQIIYLAPLLRTEPPSIATMKRFLAGLDSGDARKLLAALFRCDATLTRIAWLQKQFSQLDQVNVAPSPLLTGDDLIAHGQKPGKIFKRILSLVYDAQLEDRIATKEDALKFATRLAEEKES